VSTYTYDPLIGMTSQCDANNKISYYVYDAANRLSLIRDQDNNILKKICYNYAWQLEDCPLVNSVVPRWATTGNTRCQPCATNTLYNSGVREREEKDINPNSPTYNSPPRWVVDPTGACPTANYSATSNVACQQVNGLNTGNGIQNTADVNPCSPSFSQPGPPIITANYAGCAPCNPACIVSPQYQCINGVCVQGVLKVVKVRKISKTQWECTKAYCFPTNNGGLGDSYTIGTSTYTEITTGPAPCTIECF
jgi:hypothetical protein